MVLASGTPTWALAMLTLALVITVESSTLSHLNDELSTENSEWNSTIKGTGHGEPGHDTPAAGRALSIGLLIFCPLLVRNAFYMIPKLPSILPESCMLIVVGAVTGLCTSELKMEYFTHEIFFFIMLPTIILNTGYSMPSRLFFEHLGTIWIFATIGTIWNSVSIGLSLWAVGLTGWFGELRLANAMVFSALVSAVDPVAVLAIFEEIQVSDVLYIIVLGESLLNDAVTVALYRLCNDFVQVEAISAQDMLINLGLFLVAGLGGTIIGVLWGFLTGLVTRFAHHARDVEPIYIIVMSYLAYTSAECARCSGILSMTFCGMTMRSYVKANISFKSQTTVKYYIKALSSTSEAVIFFLIGMLTVNGNEAHEWNHLFVFFTILFCLIFRSAGVVVLTYVANRWRLCQLDNVEKIVLSYGGLRGAVSFALATFIDAEVVRQKNMFLTTTIAVVFFTIFVQGITIRPLVKFLDVKLSTKRKVTMNERIHEIVMDNILVAVEGILGQIGYARLRYKFKRFDNRFLRPVLARDQSVNEPKILETYSKLTMKDALELMKQNGPILALINGSDSMAAFIRNVVARHLDQVWNVDTGELKYRPVGRDPMETELRRFLWKPLKTRKRFSFSRVDDRQYFTVPQFKHNVHMNIRRMISETVLNEQMQSPQFTQDTQIIAERKISIEGLPSTAVDILPWKGDVETLPVVQSEFPSWADNEEYVSYFSPTNTFLSALDKDKPNHRTVIGFFHKGAMSRVVLASKTELAVGIPEEDEITAQKLD